jgi:hypothetical protein
MGYYTYFSLDIIHGDKSILDTEEFHEYFERVTSYDYSDLEYESIKWNNHEADMTKISLAYPTTVFELYGDGEDSDDYWRQVFVNGHSKTSIAELVYPPIDIKSIANIGETHPEIFI